MVWRISLAIVLLLALPLTALGQAPPEEGVEYRIVMTCPGEAFAGSCPITAVDGQDAMGDPALAVDPDRPEEMILASLHGSGDAGGPENKSRGGQVFTTFTTQNGGAFWTDNPYFPPAAISGNAFGVHPAITIDPYAHVFVGSLYAIPVTNDDRGPDGRYDYVIAAQKFQDIGDINRNQDGTFAAEYLGSVYAGNAIRQMWFEFNPVTDNMTMVWTETLTPHSLEGQGDGTSHVSRDLDDVLRLAQAHKSKPAAATDPVKDAVDLAVSKLPQSGRGPSAAADGHDAPRSVIGVAWTGADMSYEYGVQPRREVIGPCSTSTNPVISENWLYVGCKVADEGPPPWNPDAEPGDIAMFRMHPDGGEPQYIGMAPVSDGKPKLGVRSDGRIAVMTADVLEGKLRLDAAYGHYDESKGRIAWGRTHSYGDKVEALSPNVELVDANVQDMIYREYSGVVHMVLKRVIEPRVAATDQVRGATLPTIQKAILAIDEKHGLLEELHLDLGNPINRTQDPALMAMSDDVFNDISDDFLELPPGPFEYRDRPLGDLYQREFFAVADYGIVLFAEIIEITELRGPAWAAPPPPPPPPVPAAAPATVPAVASAGALTMTAIMAGTMATQKRKSVTRAGRKKRY